MSYLEPGLPLLLVLGIVGLIRAWRKSARGSRPVLLTICISGIFVLSLNAFAWLFALPLEGWYDAEDPVPKENADAIVVFAGSINLPLPNQPYAYAASDTYRRLQRGIWLYRQWRPLPFLVCGSDPGGKGSYTEIMRHVLETEGVQPDRIWTESQSRNTHENAVNGAEILRSHGINRVFLVVEANSMPRAAASLQKAGISVVPAPIRFTRLRWEFTDIVPHWQAIELNAETAHEMVGLLWYKLRGWI